ncbi:hypothetical protein KHS38_02020 [Mucilaginibacter sp. Bleaf8]|uniref:hypothetical protein n=1 Tax=Mucilaginibacter sp. Bleaf8 TaxID=2834430 RepID=UPI001BCDF901|nr:hypothetical protein [Mucilaginibacter sp. Bleaf8]MBS7563170.1 hypothetical protein [Mucilaginibacter sp. Bleaf8]
MSGKSARPVRTKEEALFEKVKNAISDIWENTTDKVEELKDKAEEKIDDLKSSITEKKSSVTDATGNTKATKVKSPSSAKPKAKVANEASSMLKHPKTEGAALKKAAKKKAGCYISHYQKES